MNKKVKINRRKCTVIAAMTAIMALVILFQLRMVSPMWFDIITGILASLGFMWLAGAFFVWLVKSFGDPEN